MTLHANSHRFVRALRRLLLGATLVPVLGFAAEGTATTDAQADQALSNAVVKIWTTRLPPDLLKPWNKQSSSSITGSGVVIEGRRILTNAHVALYASQIQVQANGSGDKLTATVEAIAPGIDLAVLKLEDESFFKTHAPMPRAAGLPAIKESVLAYGFPTGGDSQSVTKGIVSRIEFVNYRYQMSGLRIQVDAAINPGNSGGPVISGDKMIGLTFSNIPTAQNIGYIIPNEEIEIFLKDIADGRYDGKPSLFDTFQALENPALRAFLKLDKDTKGVVTYKPLRSDASYPLKKWDVLTHIGETPVDAQGMVTLENGLRVSLRYMVQKMARNGSVPVTVIRAGKSISIQVPAPASVPKLIPELAGGFPPYFIYGPIAFTKATSDLLPSLQATTPANANMLNSMIAWSLMGSPLVTQRSEESTAEKEELVMVAGPFFSSKITNGYKSMSLAVIKTVNGTPVHSLAHLVTLLRDMKEPFVTFETQMQGGEAVSFNHQDMLNATEEVLSNNGIRAQASDALLKVWRGQAAR